MRLSLRRGITIVFACVALGVGFSCVCLVWFVDKLHDTTTHFGEAVARHQLGASCRRDHLLREMATSPAVKRRLGADIERRVAEIHAGSRDAGARAAAADALGALETGMDSAADEALTRLEERQRLHVVDAQAESESWHRTATMFAATTAAVVVASAAFFVSVMLRRVRRPILDLRACINAYRGGGTDECKVDGPEEICDLAEAFNALARRLRDQRQAHSTFIAGVAHDLRNPIHVLHAAVELAEQSGPASARSERIVDVIRRQLGQLERLVTDLLDTTNLEAGKLKLEIADHDLREVVANVHRLVAVGRDDLKLSLTVPSSRVDIACDGRRIEQVVLNVVNNAVKYSPDDKDVRIEVIDGDDRACVVVRDRGVGMSEEQLAHLFEPYTRGGEERRSVPGHGLGLFTSRCIVEQHGGAIRVESAPGQGSVFRIVLPRRAA